MVLLLGRRRGGPRRTRARVRLDARRGARAGFLEVGRSLWEDLFGRRREDASIPTQGGVADVVAYVFESFDGTNTGEACIPAPEWEQNPYGPVDGRAEINRR